MYREIPCLNGIIARKWTDYERTLHYKNIRTAKGLVAVQPPRKFKHFQTKLKTQQLQEGRLPHSADRFTEIERENRILLEKMTVIMHKEGAGGAGGGVSTSPKMRRAPSPFVKRSLNLGARRQQSERVRT